MKKFVFLLLLLLLSGCATGQRQAASTETASTAVVTGSANEIKTEIVNKIEQVQNQIWPWLIGFAFLILGGGVIIMAMLLVFFRLLDKAMTEIGEDSCPNVKSIS